MCRRASRRSNWSEYKNSEGSGADADERACDNVSYKVYSQKNAGDTEQDAEGEEYDAESKLYRA